MNNSIDSFEMEKQYITNSTDLYEFYRSQEDEEYTYNIKLDLKRTALGNEDFKIDPATGKNPLFNVLNAYAHYDPVINYC